MNHLDAATAAYVSEELFNAGRCPEFGTVVEGTRFVVEVETPEGFRFRHSRIFMTSHWVEQECFPYWQHNLVADMDNAQHLADRINARLANGGKLAPEHWTPVQGRYGSAAWDEMAELELELREEEESHWH